jgi:hypothetical protein
MLNGTTKHHNMNDKDFTDKSQYIITLSKEGKEIGKLDFNGDKLKYEGTFKVLKFEGDAEKSAEIFMVHLLHVFNQRIEEIKKEAFDAGLEAEYLSYKDSFIDNQ